MDNSKDRVGPEVVVRNTAPVIWDKAYISRVWSGSLTIHRKWASFSLLSEKSHAAAAKSLQSCPTLCDPIDGSPPGSSVPGILQARTLEWVALSFSNAWQWKVKVKSLSRAWLLATPWTAAYQAPPSMRFPRQEYWSGWEFTCLDLKLHILFRNEDQDLVKASQQAILNFCSVLPELAWELWSQMSPGVSLTL